MTNDIDDDCGYAACEDCRRLVSGGLYDCHDDIRRCRRCFDRAAKAYCAAYVAREAKEAAR
jgi:hypothetical protein